MSWGLLQEAGTHSTEISIPTAACGIGRATNFSREQAERRALTTLGKEYIVDYLRRSFEYHHIALSYLMHLHFASDRVAMLRGYAVCTGNCLQNFFMVAPKHQSPS